MKERKCKRLLGFLLLMLAVIFYSNLKAEAAIPAAPRGLHQTEAGTYYVTVGWDNVAGKDVRYTIQYSEDQINWKTVLGQYSKNTSASIFGLAPASDYYFRVKAYEFTIPLPSKEEYSPWSNVFTAATVPGTIPDKSLVQTGADSSSVAVQWGSAPGANRYQVYIIKDGKMELAGVTTGMGMTIRNLKAGKEYPINIVAQKVMPGGYAASQNTYDNRLYAVTAPAQLKDVKVKRTNPYTNSVLLNWKFIEDVRGAELQLYSYKNKKIGRVKSLYSHLSLSTYQHTLNNVKPGAFYKLKYRPYIYNRAGKKYYGPWGTTYVGNEIKPKVKLLGKGVQLTWKKVHGATNYTIYISDKQKSGYKKAGITRSNSFVVKKYKKKDLKKGKRYYFYLVVNKNVKGKIYKVSCKYSGIKNIQVR